MATLNLKTEEAETLAYTLSQMDWNGLIDDHKVPCSNNDERESLHRAIDALLVQLNCSIKP